MRLISVLIIFCFPTLAFAQAVQPISAKEMAEAYDTRFPIYKGFSWMDKAGSWKVLLCENQLQRTNKDTVSTALQAVCLLEDHGGYLEKWLINDFIDKEAEETRIWFATSYCAFRDLDNDGRVDPVIVYMTADGDGVRRVKLIVVHQHVKFVVRAVEHVSDYGRKLEYGPGFASLPAAIRQAVGKTLQRIREERGLLLKNG